GVRRFEPDRVVCFVAIDELQGKNPSRTDVAALCVVCFVDDAKAVAFAQVADEVDLAAKDVGHLQGDRVGDAGRFGGAEQRRLNFTLGYADMGLSLLGFFRGLKPAVFVRADFEPSRQRYAVLGGSGRMEVAQPDQLAFLVERSLYGASG